MRSTNRLAPTLALLICVVTRPAAALDPAATPDHHDHDSHSISAITPLAARERLKEGNARFVANTTKKHDWSAEVAATASGQSPFVAILGCMDSRAPIEIVFDQGIGDVFGVRVAGNVVNEDELGSLEYAVKVGTRLIVVPGHTGCGAVKGALDDVKLGNLTGLLAKVRPAVVAAGCNDSKDAACVTRVAEENVRETMKQIVSKSAYLAEGLAQGRIEVVGAMYDVATGKVAFLAD